MNPRTVIFVTAVALSACTAQAPATNDAVPAIPEPATPAPDNASPWEAARARGIVFRGIGTEPGWLVEVGKGETPSLHAELDYGERKLDATHVQALSGILGYAGTTTDGMTVKLHLQREGCSDGMSDDTYPVAARLVVGDKAYSGCGRFLQE